MRDLASLLCVLALAMVTPVACGPGNGGGGGSGGHGFGDPGRDFAVGDIDALEGEDDVAELTHSDQQDFGDLQLAADLGNAVGFTGAGDHIVIEPAAIDPPRRLGVGYRK